LNFGTLQAQYLEEFSYAPNQFAKNNIEGWRTVTGDGDVEFMQKFDGNSVTLSLDPRNDERNIWYAFLHRDISSYLDVEKLKTGKFELRIETRLKASHAPRRVNMYISRLDQGGYLREFDIPESNNWYTISMTTEEFVYDSQRPLMAQISLMDWGLSDVYKLTIDYIKVDIVEKENDLPQYGLPLIYRPQIPPVDYYTNSLNANFSSTVDKLYPNLDLSTLTGGEENDQLILVDNTKLALLSWDFDQYKDVKIEEAGLLELTTFSGVILKDNPKDFGEIRVCEVFGGNAINDKEISYNALKENGFEINAQTTIDYKIDQARDGKTLLTISKPVLDRLVSGKTKALAILPLGLINAAFFGSNSQNPPRLLFKVK